MHDTQSGQAQRPTGRAGGIGLSLIALAGCASVAVSDEALETHTAAALSLSKGYFTISERVDSGLKTTYKVQTKTGKTYSCYVMGTVSVMGRTVSDAICHEPGAHDPPATSSATATPSPPPAATPAAASAPTLTSTRKPRKTSTKAAKTPAAVTAKPQAAAANTGQPAPPPSTPCNALLKAADKC